MFLVVEYLSQRRHLLRIGKTSLIIRIVPNEHKKKLTISDIFAWQNITIRDISVLTKIADMSRFMSPLMMLSNCQISIFQVQGSLRVRPNFAGGAEPGRADLARPRPCPAQPVMFQVTGPRPTRFVRFRSHTPSARPGPRDSSLTSCPPGLAREILRIFSLFLRSVSPPPRCFEAAKCSSARVQRCLWGSRLLSTNGIRSRV